jgi:hypothetical protein
MCSWYPDLYPPARHLHRIRSHAQCINIMSIVFAQLALSYLVLALLLLPVLVRKLLVQGLVVPSCEAPRSDVSSACGASTPLVPGSHNRGAARVGGGSELIARAAAWQGILLLSTNHL